MAAIYFLAGGIAGMAIAWYLTKQYYDAHYITIKEHQRILNIEPKTPEGPEISNPPSNDEYSI